MLDICDRIGFGGQHEKCPVAFVHRMCVATPNGMSNKVRSQRRREVRIKRTRSCRLCGSLRVPGWSWRRTSRTRSRRASPNSSTRSALSCVSSTQWATIAIATGRARPHLAEFARSRDGPPPDHHPWREPRLLLEGQRIMRERVSFREGSRSEPEHAKGLRRPGSVVLRTWIGINGGPGPCQGCAVDFTPRC